MESQPQNPEFRINPENFHPCFSYIPISLLKQAWTASYFVQLSSVCMGDSSKFQKS